MANYRSSTSADDQDDGLHSGNSGDSSDGYVDPRFTQQLKKEYQQAQKEEKEAPTKLKGGTAINKPAFSSFALRPRRRTANYNTGWNLDGVGKNDHEDLVSSDDSSGVCSTQEPTRKNLTRYLQTKHRFQPVRVRDPDTYDSSEEVRDPRVNARWAERQSEENQKHSFVNVFLPTGDDVQRWIAQKAPEPFHSGKHKASSDSFFHFRAKKMPFNATPASRPSNHIVEEYMTPSDSFTETYDVFKSLSDAQKAEVIRREAQDNGMEKPIGYNVSFHYNPHVEYHHFGSSHPMKPWRLTLTKQLVIAYGLEYCMDLYEPRPATFDELTVFHDREYTQFISQITPQNMKQHEQALASFGFAGESNDCPVFEGLWNYVCLYSGASMHAAQNLLNHQSDIAINWSGGLHHARKGAASGFCYVNDIVLAIQHLLTQHQRVLYIDIDVHHGDGVEAAFESTDRVFTLSYHKYGIDRSGWPFFPGTGSIDDTGPSDPVNRGKGHALNIPIDDGIDDDQYKWLFKTVTGAVVEKYRPEAIVLQSGADSLGGDRLGRFNLNIQAHGFCVETVKNYGRPILLIGGGGYTPRNVARTWCHETSVCVGAKLHNNLPTHLPYIQAFTGEENGGGILYPDLHNTKRHDNANTTKSLQNIVERAMENLRVMEGAPSVVVNTRGIPEEQLMKIREEIDRELEEEREDRMHLSVEKQRRTRERNIGGRGERLR